MEQTILIASDEIRKIIQEEVANGITKYASELLLEKRLNSEQLYDHFNITRPTGIKLKRFLIKTGQLNPVVSENGREYFLFSEVISINPKQVLRLIRQSK